MQHGMPRTGLKVCVVGVVGGGSVGAKPVLLISFWPKSIFLTLANTTRMDTVFGIPVINVLWTIVAGKRFEREDRRVQRMMVLLNRQNRQRKEQKTRLSHKNIYFNFSPHKVFLV